MDRSRLLTDKAPIPRERGPLAPTLGSPGLVKPRRTPDGVRWSMHPAAGSSRDATLGLPLSVSAPRSPCAGGLGESWGSKTLRRCRLRAPEEHDVYSGILEPVLWETVREHDGH